MGWFSLYTDLVLALEGRVGVGVGVLGFVIELLSLHVAWVHSNSGTLTSGSLLSIVIPAIDGLLFSQIKSVRGDTDLSQADFVKTSGCKGCARSTAHLVPGGSDETIVHGAVGGAAGPPVGIDFIQDCLILRTGDLQVFRGWNQAKRPDLLFLRHQSHQLLLDLLLGQDRSFPKLKVHQCQ